MFAIHFMCILTWDFLPFQLLYFIGLKEQKESEMEMEMKMKTGKYTCTHNCCRSPVPSNINNVNKYKMLSIPLTHPHCSHWLWFCLLIPVYFIHCVMFFMHLYLTQSMLTCSCTRSKTMKRNERACKQIIHIFHNSTAYFIAVFQCSFGIVQQNVLYALRFNILFSFQTHPNVIYTSYYLT